MWTYRSEISAYRVECIPGQSGDNCAAFLALLLTGDMSEAHPAFYSSVLKSGPEHPYIYGLLNTAFTHVLVVADVR